MNSYKLLLANYSGNAGDSLRYHNNTNFSTKNKDNDKCVDNCAELRHGKNIHPPHKICCGNEPYDLTLSAFFHRWILVQLLHWLKSKWCVLPPWITYQEYRWHLLVRMARTKLFTETGGDEDPTTNLCAIKTLAKTKFTFLLTTKPWHQWINIIYSLNWANFFFRGNAFVWQNVRTEYVMKRCLIVNCILYMVFIS